MQRHFTYLLLAALFCTTEMRAEDWPQWQGPNGASVWSETGIVDRFPDEGLTVKWRVKISDGYAGPAVSKGKVYVTDYVISGGKPTNNPGGRDSLDGTERVLCLDAETGEELWRHEEEVSYNISYPRGPRATPTVDGDRVYTLGAEGNLLCLATETGNIIWRKNFAKEFKAPTPNWGHSAHPLIDGDLLYCLVGGEGSAVVAFDKRTGNELWRALTTRDIGYCPPTMVENAAGKQLLIWHTQSLNSLDPKTGKLYWTLPLNPSYGMSIAAPRQQGNFVYVSGVGNEAVLLRLDEEKPGYEIVWDGGPKTAVYATNSTPLIIGNVIYGNDCHSGNLMGVNLETGERLWESFEATTGGDRKLMYATAFLVKHDDRFFIFNENGDLILANLTPEGYEEISRFHLLEPTNSTSGRDVVWSHPAFANRCVYARNDQELVCASLATD